MKTFKFNDVLSVSITIKDDSMIVSSIDCNAISCIISGFRRLRLIYETTEAAQKDYDRFLKFRGLEKYGFKPARKEKTIKKRFRVI